MKVRFWFIGCEDRFVWDEVLSGILLAKEESKRDEVPNQRNGCYRDSCLDVHVAFQGTAKASDESIKARWCEKTCLNNPTFIGCLPDDDAGTHEEGPKADERPYFGDG